MIDPLGSPPVASHARKNTPLWQAAQALEQNFLSEMLKPAGLGPSDGAFSGGIGEEQFSSFLRGEQAKAMTDAGGIGLAERIYDSLVERIDGHE